MQCVVPLPTEGTFILYPNPLEISIPVGACHTPPAPPEISVIIQPGLVSPGKNSSVKNAVAIYIYAKDNWRGIWIYISWNYNYRLF